MSDYLLDTNIVRYWYDTRCAEHEAVLARVQEVRQPHPQTQYVPRFFISVVTLGEIEFGHGVAPGADVEEQSRYVSFVREECPEPLEIVTHVAKHYGTLKAWLFNNCSDKRSRAKSKRLDQLVEPITAKALGADENDLWIAAQAMTHNLVLVTHDSRGNFGRLLHHFAATPQKLQVEDWAR